MAQLPAKRRPALTSQQADTSSSPSAAPPSTRTIMTAATAQPACAISESLPASYHWTQETVQQVNIAVAQKPWSELHDFLGISSDQLDAALTVDPEIGELLNAMDAMQVEPFERGDRMRLFDTHVMPRKSERWWRATVFRLVRCIDAVVLRRDEQHAGTADLLNQLLTLCDLMNAKLTVTNEAILDFAVGSHSAACRADVSVSTLDYDTPNHYIVASIDKRSDKRYPLAIDVQATGICQLLAAALRQRQSASGSNLRAPVYLLCVKGANISIYRSALTETQFKDLQVDGQCTDTGHVWQLAFEDGATSLSLDHGANRRTLFSVLTAIRKTVMTWVSDHDVAVEESSESMDV